MMYLVFNKNGRQPQVIHPTEMSAKLEAERLARLNPGDEFFVLKPIASVKKIDVEWTNLEQDQIKNEIPF